ncbi:MAG: phosphonate C-P lyase system protein PhnL [Burkholderiales bacterium]
MKPDTTPAMPVLSVRSVHKTFTLHLREGLQLPVLRGVSLDVSAGECVALVGPSGKGKSTLMKCLYGSYSVDTGHMWLQAPQQTAVDLATACPQTWVQLRRSRIAYVSQFLRALPRVPCIDVVAERVLRAQEAVVMEASDPLDDAAHEDALRHAREQAADLLARLNLPRSLWGLPPATFSGGEQQRVNIARGLVQPSTLLLLDEPTASLDATNRRTVIQLIQEAQQRGSAVVGIFHDEEVRDAVAHRCIDFSKD